jgi:hypothetical protein
MTKTCFYVAFAAALSTSSVFGAAITTGNTPGGDNVIFNACTSPILGPAISIEGCLNSAQATNFAGTGVQNLQANGG